KAGDFHLYYKYLPMSYDVTFDWNYEDAPEIEGFKYEYGVKGFSLPTNVPVRPGYTFTGWNILYTDMYSSRNYPVSTMEFDKYWTLDNVTIIGTDVKFVAHWTDSSAATISAINTMTGVTTRYTFDPTVDYTMPEGPTEQILIGTVYYKFDGWYNNSQCEGTPVTVIPAYSFDVNNSKYYSKWAPVTEGVN
ncbi:MAG: InlB B-repeat-containing protein, partial [Ruminococcus bromii]|nr:InlB B-repeat-containing protein [Ruminococcus bromii]